MKEQIFNLLREKMLYLNTGVILLSFTNIEACFKIIFYTVSIILTIYHSIKIHKEIFKSK